MLLQSGKLADLEEYSDVVFTQAPPYPLGWKMNPTMNASFSLVRKTAEQCQSI